MPAALCRGIEADGMAKRASRFDWTGLVRPRMVSKRPIRPPTGASPLGQQRDHEARPSSASMAASWARRLSNGGWVEKRVERLTPLLAMAGGKKKALKLSADRRSRVGTRDISPVTLTSAEASAEGRPVRSAPDRSAASSRYRDSAMVSRKLIA